MFECVFIWDDSRLPSKECCLLLLPCQRLRKRLAKMDKKTNKTKQKRKKRSLVRSSRDTRVKAHGKRGWGHVKRT